jgi:hypothetical protein
MLLIWGGHFDPQEVTRTLRLKPTKAWRKGERTSFRRTDGSVHYFDSRRPWSGWKKWMTDRFRERPLESQLSFWLRLLTPRRSALWKLRKNGAVVELNCCLIHRGSVNVTLPAAMISKLAALGVQLDITWYAPLPSELRKRQRTSGRRIGRA